MRVLVFGERLIPPPDEGIKKSTLSLAAACAALGHETLILTTQGADWPEPAIRDLPADRLLRSPALADRIAAFRPDAILYVPTASLTLASGLRARVLKRHAGGAPVALIATQGRRHGRLTRLAARLARPDLCVTQSGETLAQARRLGWRAVQLPPGVDTVTFHPVSAEIKRQLRAAHGLPADAFIVLHVGHLNRGRGVTDLAALADLALPVLVASSSTPQDAALAAELAGAGVRLITRFVPDVAELYQAADLYLLPTPPAAYAASSIDLPLSVLEALACDLPVLATRFGALPELWPAEPGVVFYADRAGLRSGLARLRSVRPGTRALTEPFGWPAAATAILKSLLL